MQDLNRRSWAPHSAKFEKTRLKEAQGKRLQSFIERFMRDVKALLMLAASPIGIFVLFGFVIPFF